MDQERRQGSGEVLGHVDQGICKNLSSSIQGVAIDAVTVSSSGEKTTVRGKNGTLNVMGNQSGSNEELNEGHEDAIDQKMDDQQGVSGTLRGNDQGTSNNSINLVNGIVYETVVVIDSSETTCINRDNRVLEAKVNELGLNKVSIEEPKKRVSETEKTCSVIDIKCGSGKRFGENLDGEMICRICHLDSEQLSDTTAVNANTTTSMDLIQLGCGCKDELGVAHSHCAELWFKLKGNRLCEICGQTARNVTGIGDNRFMEEWNDRRSTSSNNNSSGRGGACWRGQPFCNFLMACLVIEVSTMSSYHHQILQTLISLIGE
ncbi:putative RING/FYVE/PHD zinc finger superfamily protein [Quillaja saponaria]|uniref:RING/FYVE/PHD zinc finger superfamily protein n=1 Tax=Quillaja saponaria TaxID=32244 RepID=A0AAD7M2F6_QUISA|nr:putative RING/FYVE/PHD zinc finger superfamily protein [Quillaja saponaria]